MAHIDPRVALVGLVVGTLVGLSGVGGGSLVTPLLVLVLRVQPAVAIGTDLLYSVPTKLLGTAMHQRHKTVDWRLVRMLTAGGVPAALLGLALLGFLQRHIGLVALNAQFKHSLGVILVLVSIAIVLRPLLARRMRPHDSESEDTGAWGRGQVVRIAALGAVVGFLVSLTSIGSGSLTLPLLYYLAPRLGLRRMVGSDIAFAAILIPVAAAGQLRISHVDGALAVSLLIGSLPGVVLDSRLCAYIPEVWLRPALAGTLLFAGAKLI